MKMKIWSSGLLMTLFCSASVQAADIDKNEVTINITGKLYYPPPCVVNTDNITVPLGDMITSKVDGAEYIKEIGVTITCTAAKKDALKLSFAGDAATGTGVPAGLLKTSYDRLGIRFKTGATTRVDLNINTDFSFTKTTVPKLWLVPIKIGTAEMEPRDITATATLKIQHN
ncbi:fimbrial protein [Enterobacter soli]|uniref:fimbrial protein n=1 Tax=Enterobacter soli TaxID=885040 RepID=UPI0034CD68A6